MTSSPANSPGRDPDDVSLRDVVAILFRRLKGMVVIFSLAMVIALVWIFFIRNDIYESTAKILVRLGYEQSPSVTVLNRQTPVVGYRHQDVATEVHILSSSDVLARVVDELNLQEMGERPRPQGFVAGLVYDLKQLLGKVDRWFDEMMIRAGLRERLSPREQVIDALQRGLRVGSSEASNVLVAALRLPYREGTAAVLSVILDTYLDARMEFFREEAAANLFRTKMNEALAELRRVETELKDLESLSDIVNLDVQQELLLRREEQLQAQIKADLLELAALRDKLRAVEAVRISEVSFGSVGTFPQGSFAGNLMSQLAEINGEKIRLEMAASGRDQRSVDENRRRFDATLGLLRSSLESSQAELRALISGREAALAAVRAELGALHGRKTAWQDLLRKSELLESDYKFYRHELGEATATASMQNERISNVKVIQHPTDPLRPAGIRKLYLILISAVLAGFAAIAWAALVEFFDRRVYSASQVASRLGVPVAGVVPLLRPDQLSRTLKARAGRA